VKKIDEKKTLNSDENLKKLISNLLQIGEHLGFSTLKKVCSGLRSYIFLGLKLNVCSCTLSCALAKPVK
jgi:hypothetical protein